jgi:hypothetical protein
MPEKKDISREILEYLHKHPDASDTLEGIAEWWILSERIHDEIGRVKAAVFKLMKQGWVIEIRGRNSAVRYRFNPVKRRQIRSCV